MNLKAISRLRRSRVLLAFAVPLAVSLAIGLASGIPGEVASAQPLPTLQGDGYAGPETCGICHEEIHELWEDTLHANAFSSPIFQQNWGEIGSEFRCLECHTTGYDTAIGDFAFEGVTCESCHGPFVEGHPVEPMPVQADAELCATCHETTTNEWRASQHGFAEIQCQSCHDPHSQRPKAESVTALCTSCHQERGSSFTHGTHADAGLECSSCHMYTDPSGSPSIEGLVATGHTFTVGSQACIGCHQESVHTRDTILQLSGELETLETIDITTLQQRLQEQEQSLAESEAGRSARLYVGLAQGGMVGLAVGSVSAWIVSRKLRFVEDEDLEEPGESDVE